MNRERLYHQFTGFLALMAFCSMIWACTVCPSFARACPPLPVSYP